MVGNKFSFPAPCHHLYKTHLQRLTSYFMHVAHVSSWLQCASSPNCFQPTQPPPHPPLIQHRTISHRPTTTRWENIVAGNFLAENKFSIVNYQVSQGLIERWEMASLSPSSPFPSTDNSSSGILSPRFSSRVPFRRSSFLPVECASCQWVIKHIRRLPNPSNGCNLTMQLPLMVKL